MNAVEGALKRRQRELRILNDSLLQPLTDLPEVATVQQALEQKLRLASLLRAVDNLEHWRSTETARQPPQHVHNGAHEFSYTYQRADLHVGGPPLYPQLTAFTDATLTEPVYTASGMSAIATLMTAVRQCGGPVRVRPANGCYDETCELLHCLGPDIRFDGSQDLPNGGDATRILWLDSSAAEAPLGSTGPRAGSADTDLLVLDTSCLWRESATIRRCAAWSLRLGLPLVLVRSHTKLDNLGIEYARLGSILLVSPGDDAGRPGATERPARFTAQLYAALQQMQRLLGVAPNLASFPPFTAHPDYLACSAERTAGIIRGTRALQRYLLPRLGAAITQYHHGLYFTIALRGIARDAVVELAAKIASATAVRGLSTRHAGSFGFDFVAIDRHPAPHRETDDLRIAGADLPANDATAIAEGIAEQVAGHVG